MDNVLLPDLAAFDTRQLVELADIVREKTQEDRRYTLQELSQAIQSFTPSSIVDQIFNREIEVFDNAECTELGAYILAGCGQLRKVNAPNARYVGVEAFRQDTRLSEVYLPKADHIRARAFYMCHALTQGEFWASQYEREAFYFSGLKKLILHQPFNPNAQFYIGPDIVIDCIYLRELYILSKKIPVTEGSIVGNRPPSNWILYVRPDMVDAFKNDQDNSQEQGHYGFSHYADHIQPYYGEEDNS